MNARCVINKQIWRRGVGHRESRNIKGEEEDGFVPEPLEEDE